ncbi:hypothetical protein R1sor_023248 [Riccia sorocarpa]|uniref:ATP-dependent RNA helicase n=1 Tax=Riccia sorocarpa TaxID=122646 RepID=A0ABD3GP86_9MARC
MATCSLILSPASAGRTASYKISSYYPKNEYLRNYGSRQIFSRKVFKGSVEIDDSLGTSFAELVKSPSPFYRVTMMGGKERSYPGGVTKWQWKRRQAKEERKLELKRLSMDKRLFSYRRRQEVKNAEPWISSLDLSLSGSSAEVENELVNTVTSSFKDLELGAWQGTRTQVSRYDELQQIERVKALLGSGKASQQARDEEFAATSFEGLELSAPSLKALYRTIGRPSLAPLFEAILPTMQTGKDLLVRTRGGTDDIVASLLHGSEVSSETPRCMTVSGRHSVHVLLLCPTTDQVETARHEAKKLLMFHSKIRLQVVMGGSDMKEEMKRLRTSPSEILVATPGRLLGSMKSSAEFRAQLRGVKLLVLIDAQMLLDMGYQKTIESILSLLPRTRQTIVWSRTLSDQVSALSSSCLKQEHAVINTCEGEAEDGTTMETQEYITAPTRMHLAVLFRDLKAHFELDPKAKVVVFCQTVRTATFFAALFRNLGFCTREIHYRKNENVRSRIAAEFRTSQEGMILFTSGASVWGVGNPDVSLVIQVGSPATREQYVRRVKPTGPTIKRRVCLLILMSHERSFLEQLRDLSVSENVDLQLDPGLAVQVQQALGEVDYEVRVKAYVAWLRYHVMKELTDRGREEILCLASEYALSLGFKEPPVISRKIAAQLGLSKVALSAIRWQEDIYG